jgi:hypothetical protein
VRDGGREGGKGRGSDLKFMIEEEEEIKGGNSVCFCHLGI